jgi:hypothetical protein
MIGNHPKKTYEGMEMCFHDFFISTRHESERSVMKPNLKYKVSIIQQSQCTILILFLQNISYETLNFH